VTPEEVRKLRELLTEVEDGKRFLLQGGDCAERFLDCSAPNIEAKLRILLQMSLVLSWSGGLPCVRVGRLAGQYAKPRSSDYEVVDGKKVLAFRGDCVNDIDPANREPDAERLTQAYFHAAATLNHVRSLVSGGFAGLDQSTFWQLDHVKNEKRKQQYTGIVDQLKASLKFMRTCAVPLGDSAKGVDFFTSHEGLCLPFEAALAREEDGAHYATSAHFLWIGDRTRQLDGAHVEFFRGVENPVGIKVGPTAEPEVILDIVKKLNPNNEGGKIVLITRMGEGKVASHLPKHIKALKEAGLRAVWQCDPMHGNTYKVEAGGAEYKTRNFDSILNEVVETVRVHQECGSRLMGLHFELTGEDVTECVGGPQELESSDLSRSYTTYCDPRLNVSQSLEMAFRLTEVLPRTE